MFTRTHGALSRCHPLGASAMARRRSGATAMAAARLILRPTARKSGRRMKATTPGTRAWRHSPPLSTPTPSTGEQSRGGLARRGARMPLHVHGGRRHACACAELEPDGIRGRGSQPTARRGVETVLSRRLPGSSAHTPWPRACAPKARAAARHTDHVDVDGYNTASDDAGRRPVPRVKGIVHVRRAGIHMANVTPCSPAACAMGNPTQHTHARAMHRCSSTTPKDAPLLPCR